MRRARTHRTTRHDTRPPSDPGRRRARATASRSGDFDTLWPYSCNLPYGTLHRRPARTRSAHARHRPDGDAPLCIMCGRQSDSTCDCAALRNCVAALRSNGVSSMANLSQEVSSPSSHLCGAQRTCHCSLPRNTRNPITSSMPIADSMSSPAAAATRMASSSMLTSPSVLASPSSSSAPTDVPPPSSSAPDEAACATASRCSCR